MLNIFLVRFATDMIETLLGEITRILIENPIVSRRTTALLEFQLSSLGMKGCDNPCHPNQPRVRHASSANPTQISSKSIFIHAAHFRQFDESSTKVGARHLLPRGVFVSIHAELEAINKKGETALHRPCSFKKGVIRCFAIKGWLRWPH